MTPPPRKPAKARRVWVLCDCQNDEHNNSAWLQITMMRPSASLKKQWEAHIVPALLTLTPGPKRGKK